MLVSRYTYKIRDKALGLIGLVLILVMAGCLSNNSDDTNETENDQSSDLDSVEQQYNLDPMIVSGFEDVIPASSDIVDLAVNGDKVAFLSTDEQNETSILTVGSLTDDMEEITLLDEFTTADDEESATSITWIPNTNHILLNGKEEGSWHKI